MSIMNLFANYGDKTNFQLFSRSVSKVYFAEYYINISNSIIMDMELRGKINSYISNYFSQINDEINNVELAKILHPTPFWLGIYDVIVSKQNSSFLLYEWKGVDSIIHSTANYQYFASEYTKELKKTYLSSRINIYSYMFQVFEWLLADVFGRVDALIMNTRVPKSLWVGPVTTDHLIASCKIPRDRLARNSVTTATQCKNLVGFHGKYEVDLSIPPFNCKSHTSSQMKSLFDLFNWGPVLKVKGANYSMFRSGKGIKLNKLLTPMIAKESEESLEFNDYPVLKDAAIMSALTFLYNNDAMYDVMNYASFVSAPDKGTADINDNLFLKSFSKHNERTSLLDIINYLY